jgi:hypothetical protein
MLRKAQTVQNAQSVAGTRCFALIWGRIGRLLRPNDTTELLKTERYDNHKDSDWASLVA